MEAGGSSGGSDKRDGIVRGIEKEFKKKEITDEKFHAKLSELSNESEMEINSGGSINFHQGIHPMVGCLI